MAVVICPVGASLILEVEWPADARDLTDCTGQSQVRSQPSAAASLLLTGTVTIDTGATPQTITIEFDPDDTGDMDEGGRGFLDFRLEWLDGEVQFPLQDQIVELEFTPTVTVEV